MQQPPSLQWAAWPDTTDDDFASWVTSPYRHNYGRCDRCGKRRLFFRLYDVWRHELKNFGWVCADCLIDLITYLDEKARRR